MVIPITKSGKAESEEPFKFHPIYLLDTSGNVLEKLMFNRMKHHVYLRDT